MDKRSWMLLWSFGLTAPATAEEGYVDFSDRMTPVCEVQGLRAAPPEGWFNVPVHSGDPKIRGCQMMRTGEDEGLAGILRLMSVDASGQPEHPPWQGQVHHQPAHARARRARWRHVRAPRRSATLPAP